MGYTDGGSPKGGPLFNSSPQTVADLNAGRAFTEKLGNRRVGPTTERNVLAGKDRWKGLEWYDTTLERTFVDDGGGGWDSEPSFGVLGTALLGAYPASGAPQIRRTGIVTITTNVDGVATVPIPAGTFPNGILGLSVQRYDHRSYGATYETILYGEQSLTAIKFRVYVATTGNPLPNAPDIAYFIEVVGW